jgi:hypothetical protein
MKPLRPLRIPPREPDIIERARVTVRPQEMFAPIVVAIFALLVAYFWLLMK